MVAVRGCRRAVTSGSAAAGYRRQFPEADLAAFGSPPRVVAGLMDGLRLIARMLRRIVVPPLGTVRAARQGKAEDLLDLLEREHEIGPRLLHEKIIKRLEFVLVPGHARSALD